MGYTLYKGTNALMKKKLTDKNWVQSAPDLPCFSGESKNAR